MKNFLNGALGRAIVAAALLAGLAACGGGGGGDTTPPKDTTAPFVVVEKVTPTVGTAVPNSGLIVTVPFSEALACFTGIKTFTFSTAGGGVGTGNYTCVGSTVVFAIDNASIANATSMNLTIANLADLAGNVMVPASWSYTITPPPLEHYGEVVYTVFDAGTSSRTETEIEVVTETGKTRVKNSTSFQYDPNFPNALILSTCGLYKLARADGLVWATCVAQKDHLRHCFLLHPAKQELKDADSGVCPAYPATQAESTNWVLAVDVPKATTSKGEFFAPLNLNVARIDFRANDGTTKTVFNGTFAADGRVAFLVSFPAF